MFALEAFGLHKCETPLQGRGLHPIWSRKEVLPFLIARNGHERPARFMRLLLLLLFLRILRAQRLRLRIEIDL